MQDEENEKVKYLLRGQEKEYRLGRREKIKSWEHKETHLISSCNYALNERYNFAASCDIVT